MICVTVATNPVRSFSKDMGGAKELVKVVVDPEKCNGDGVCASVCPVAVFEMQEVQGQKKSVVVNNDACIVCRACEVQCPTQAITVTE